MSSAYVSSRSLVHDPVLILLEKTSHVARKVRCERRLFMYPR